MYAEHYGLTAAPFQLTPDSRFFFGSSGHSRALSHLVYGLSQEEGFVVVTGEVGAGKTTLVERLAGQLDQGNWTIARIGHTLLGGDDLLRLTAAGFGIDIGVVSDKAGLLAALEAGLRAHTASGRRCLLVVDEVQSLSVPALEELRMLSNSAHNGRALLQTILLGQPQFRATLVRRELDQLRQRVLASYHLGPLTAAETGAYVTHRLRTAGWTETNPAIEPAALAALHAHTGGIPRRINRLCSRVLLYAALEGAQTLTAAMVEVSATELANDLGAGTAQRPRRAAVRRVTRPPAPDTAALERRVASLEQAVARRERIFIQLLELLSAYTETRGRP